MVDWSGGNDRGAAPKKDAIWAGVHRKAIRQDPIYLRNRQVAEAWLTSFFAAEIAAGRRVLAGFDFPFGYPKGFARALTGSDNPLMLWDWLEREVEDTPKSNNRFDLAGAINCKFGGGQGPFWFNGLARDIEGLPRRKDEIVAHFPERRACEILAPGSFTCWQMGGAGAVGGQIFTGLAVLARLRRQFDVAVWPFEPLHVAISFVEIWPSLTVTEPPPDMIKDAWQVSEVARQLSLLSEDRLRAMLDVQAPEEGWIFGLGFEQELRGEITPPLRNDCFALPPGIHWTPVEDALALLRERLHPVVSTEICDIRHALGRVAAADVTAPRAHPPLPNTAVDGFGVAGHFGEGAHRIPLAQGRAAAGDAPKQLPQGKAIKVLTGAALPSGVETVILQEDVAVADGAIHFQGPIRSGANTRAAGEDVIAGGVIVHRGRVITASDVALLSATGCSALPTYRSLKVGVLSTGDELVQPGTSAAPGQVYDANRPMLMALISRFGHVPVDLGHVGDDREALQQRFDDGARSVDVMLSSGGASTGEEDHVSAVLETAGAMALWRIAVKPGRPLALGMWRSVPIFGLPGNPVAAMVCTLIFARPALSLLSGAGWSEPHGFELPAAFSKRKKAGRREYLRARVRDGKVEVFASEGSGRISGLSWAEGLVELPEPAMEIGPGDVVRFLPYSSFGL
ncbi:MAG: molybdopterin-binding protein [Pseudomonadota bacterium]